MKLVEKGGHALDSLEGSGVRGVGGNGHGVERVNAIRDLVVRFDQVEVGCHLGGAFSLVDHEQRVVFVDTPNSVSKLLGALVLNERVANAFSNPICVNNGSVAKFVGGETRVTVVESVLVDNAEEVVGAVFGSVLVFVLARPGRGLPETFVVDHGQIIVHLGGEAIDAST